MNLSMENIVKVEHAKCIIFNQFAIVLGSCRVSQMRVNLLDIDYKS